MASFDPFEKEFGARARNLRRTPAARSWGDLEQRLDNRRRGTASILGIRPWMIAALVLLVAGATIISKIGEPRGNNPLAKRAEFIEDLSAPYVPTETYVPDGYLPGHAPVEDDERNPELREVPVADKYRVHG